MADEATPKTKRGRGARPPAPTEKAQRGFREAVRRLDAIERWTEIPPDRRAILTAILDRPAPDGTVRGVEYLDLLHAYAKNVLMGRAFDEEHESDGARLKTMRDEARDMQPKLKRCLRRAVAFHKKYAQELGRQAPTVFEFALADVERGLVAEVAGLEPWRAPTRGRPAVKRTHAVRVGLRQAPGLRRTEADRLASAIFWRTEVNSSEKIK